MPYVTPRTFCLGLSVSLLRLLADDVQPWLSSADPGGSADQSPAKAAGRVENLDPLRMVLTLSWHAGLVFFAFALNLVDCGALLGGRLGEDKSPAALKAMHSQYAGLHKRTMTL